MITSDSAELAQLLRVGAWVWPTRVLGPGDRFAFWLQGCPLHCSGCVAPSFLPGSGGTEMPGSDLAHRILCEPGCEGVTVSGGEPLLQARALAPVLEAVRAAGRSVILYTGFEIGEIVALGERLPSVLRACAAADVLIPGRYDAALNDSLGLRGSTNQVFHFLTPRYAHLRLLFEHGVRRRERHELGDGILLAGVPPLDRWRRSALDPTAKPRLDDAHDL